MEQSFKLDLSKLTPVEEANRIMGNYYVACDDIETEQPVITRWHSGNNQIFGGRKGSRWLHWFLIPPNLPGFPKAELPDEFELKAGEWEYIGRRGLKEILDFNLKMKRTKPTLPAITIPSGTREEQVQKLKEMLVEFETF